MNQNISHKGDIRVSYLFQVLFVILLGLVFNACSPPADKEAFWKSNLLSRVEVLSSDAMAGRKTGSAGASSAARKIEGWLKHAGLVPVTLQFAQTFVINDTLNGTNLIAAMPGESGTKKTIVISAHYDHLGIIDGEIYNGADDNASGVSAIIAIAEKLWSMPPQYNVIFAVFDGEEMGLLGAKAFLESDIIPLKDIVLNINLDMVSRSTNGVLFAAGGHHYPSIKSILDSTEVNPMITLKQGHDGPPWNGHDDWTLASDHAPFHQEGIPFVYFGVEDHDGYHNPSDDYNAITPEFYIGATKTILSFLKHFDKTAN